MHAQAPRIRGMACASEERAPAPFSSKIGGTWPPKDNMHSKTHARTRPTLGPAYGRKHPVSPAGQTLSERGPAIHPGALSGRELRRIVGEMLG